MSTQPCFLEEKAKDKERWNTFSNILWAMDGETRADWDAQPGACTQVSRRILLGRAWYAFYHALLPHGDLHNDRSYPITDVVGLTVLQAT